MVGAGTEDLAYRDIEWQAARGLLGSEWIWGKCDRRHTRIRLQLCGLSVVRRVLGDKIASHTPLRRATVPKWTNVDMGQR